MRKINKYIYALFIFVLLIVSLISKSQHSSATMTEKNIIILHEYSEGYPYHQEFNEIFIKTLNENKNYKFNYHFEYFKIDEYSNDDVYIESLVEQLKLKRELSNWEPDIVVASGGFSDFLLEYKDEIFPNIPVVSILRKHDKHKEIPPEMFAENIILTSKEDYGMNFELILDLHPDVKKIYIVIGNSESEKNIIKNIKVSAEPFNKKVEFIHLNEMSYSEMLNTVEGASDDSAIFFVRWFVDAEGKSFIPVRVLNSISEKSGAPIYGSQKQFLGEGIIGGYLHDISLVSEEVARVSLKIINGENPESIILQNDNFNDYVFDNQLLKKWNIDSKKLPSDYKIEFKEETIWNTYSEYIIANAFVIIFQTFLIIGLITNYRKRIIAEKELKFMNESLETQVYERTSDLEIAKVRLEEMNKQLKHTSRIDPLTKLYNRNYMNKCLYDAKKVFKETGEVFTVMMIDIDDFKQINDNYGHAVGDEILIMVANCLAENVREYDVVSRWGGEEFLLLFLMLDEEKSLIRAELIRKKVEQARYNYNEIDLSVTVTIGVATTGQKETIDELINRADSALYKGKNEGKNQVVCAAC